MTFFKQSRRHNTTPTSVWQNFTIKAFFLSGALALLSPEQTLAEPQQREAMEHFFHVSFKNMQEEVAQAKEEGKQGIFVMFSDPACPWCMKMKSTIMSQVAIQEYYRKHFRIIHIDTTGDGTMTNFSGKEMSEKDFAFKQHRVRATPVFMIFDLEGKDLLRYTGTSRSSREFKLLGEYIISAAYKNTNFTKYKRKMLADVAGH